MTGSPLEGLRIALKVLEGLRIDYVIIGSIASSIVGVPRATMDADVLIDADSEALEKLMDGLETQFYVSRETATQALKARGTFNVVHDATGFKIDFYVAGTDPFEQTRLARRIRLSLPDGTKLTLATPEDLILSKLRWYRLGRQLSEKQWRDAQGLMSMNPELDAEYLKRWGDYLGVADLLRDLQESTR